MVRLAAISAGVALVALLGGIWYATMPGGEGDDKYAQCRNTKVAGGADTIGGPFTLVNSAGETVTDKDVITEPSLIYFGYTFCPDVCPLDTVRNAESVDILRERGYDITPVFISIDPNRDTPEVVGDFAANLHEDMIGLTGSEEQVQAASQAYRTYFRRQPGDDDYYLVDHSTFTYLVMPEDGFVEFFRRELSPDQLAERAACFLEVVQ
ncbi:SCO family protein [Marivita geojedonensis]|uniref:Protein senC n=1 Tax=Marivita geojedonensis TaxID=1123756 RepID=A0A1X4NJM3_9RHOB|nr:SCO family protein [Marivita geojedonensis]OSQ49856.1 protein senC [Marivita geojedonensis]PRY76079.1 protein SCO1/2 [Marivita geojedonensis]